MTSYYKISGNTRIGTTSRQNLILGDTILQDAGPSDQGSIYYVNSTGYITELTPGISGQLLQTNGNASDPSWVSIMPPGATDGSSVAKNAGQTFGTSDTAITNWNITNPGATINPFFIITGSFILLTGLFTPNKSGLYSIAANIQYTNTVNDAGKTLKFCEMGTPDITLLSIGPLQPSGDPAKVQTISINQNIYLSSSASYLLKISATNSNGVNTILPASTFSLVYIST
jgi:hypothetical protein